MHALTAAASAAFVCSSDAGGASDADTDVADAEAGASDESGASEASGGAPDAGEGPAATG